MLFLAIIPLDTFVSLTDNLTIHSVYCKGNKGTISLIKKPEKTVKQIILASSSPRRRSLLEQIGLPFQVRPPDVEEHFEKGLSPSEIVTGLSMRKAEAAAEQLREGLIIGSDTVVVHRGSILGKPDSAEQAEEMLAALSGDTHEVLTGVALLKKEGERNNTQSLSFSETTEVTFGRIDYEDIRRYVASGRPMDKAGAYGIQDPMGGLFVKKIHGDYNTVVGFPLHSFCRRMKSFAPEYLDLRTH